MATAHAANRQSVAPDIADKFSQDRRRIWKSSDRGARDYWLLSDWSGSRASVELATERPDKFSGPLRRDEVYQDSLCSATEASFEQIAASVANIRVMEYHFQFRKVLKLTHSCAAECNRHVACISDRKSTRSLHLLRKLEYPQNHVGYCLDFRNMHICRASGARTLSRCTFRIRSIVIHFVNSKSRIALDFGGSPAFV